MHLSFLLLAQSLVVFFLGASLGSFTNVLIDRVPLGRKIFLDRSICEKCKKRLSARELIPVFSFIFLKGRCLKCKKNIPKRIFIVEFLFGVLYVAFFLFFVAELLSLEAFIFIGVLLPGLVSILIIDYRKGIIPDSILTYLLSIIVLYSFLFERQLFTNAVLSGIASFSFFLLLFKITKGRGMGFGDVKLVFVLGMFLGFPNIVVALYLAFLTGALVSIILVLWGKKKLQNTIPFAPFLILSALFSFFWGEKLILLLQKFI